MQKMTRARFTIGLTLIGHRLTVCKVGPRDLRLRKAGRSSPAVRLPGFCGSQAHSAIAGASNRDKRTSRLAIPAAQLASAFGVVGRGNSALPVAPNPCL